MILGCSLFDFRLSLAFLAWRRCSGIAALISRSARGLLRRGNRIAFSFGTWGAHGCAGYLSVGRMRDAET